MNTKKNIFKNTFIFTAVFLLATILFASAINLIVERSHVDQALSVYIPIEEKVDDTLLDWQEIKVLGGSGFVVDGNRVIRSYNEIFPREIDQSTQLDFLSTREKKHHYFLYDTVDGKKFFLKYPANYIKKNITFELSDTNSKLKTPFILAIVGFLILYILILYSIVNWLSKKINAEMASIYEAQEREKDLLFKGIAHDIKTPLSIIKSYAMAIHEEVITEDKRKKYLSSIEKNAQILDERVNDLLDFASLENREILWENRDILEMIRRYVGDHYTYFLEQGATIDLLFPEDEKYITAVNENLFSRLLQNLLQNPLDHNEGNITISIYFKEDKIIFLDSGKGIPEKEAEKIFQPLYTSNNSRTGEKLRGMGLANVKRICKLQGWKISYKNGFIIELKESSR